MITLRRSIVNCDNNCAKEQYLRAWSSRYNRSYNNGFFNNSYFDNNLFNSNWCLLSFNSSFNFRGNFSGYIRGNITCEGMGQMIVAWISQS